MVKFRCFREMDDRVGIIIEYYKNNDECYFSLKASEGKSEIFIDISQEDFLKLQKEIDEFSKILKEDAFYDSDGNEISQDEYNALCRKAEMIERKIKEKEENDD